MKLKFALLLTLTTVLALNTTICYGQSEKFPISVLIVGYSPDKPMPEFKVRTPGGFTIERFKEVYGTRMPAFEKLLKQYFEKVGTIDARDYKEGMSADYDVTVFDQRPTPIRERVMEYDKDGQLTKYAAPAYITENYDHATVFIGQTADNIGRSVGSKLDWLCLCLDAAAHHIKTEHPIFNTPIKVDLTMETRPTPPEIYHYESGDTVPKEIPMWQVQSEGYMDGKGYRIGMVSRGNGFLDSPDTEFISSGVCVKDVGAVAFGRHASFFLWGFSGSPDYMTEEAKKVFVNSIVYINDFDGVKPIARKRNDRVVIRDSYIDALISSASDKGYQKALISQKGYNENILRRQKAAKEKQSKGETLSESEKYALMSEPSEMPSYEEHLKSRMRGYYAQFGTDVQAFKAYLDENRGYFYWIDKVNNYALNLDEDCKALGIANRDIAILDKCVSLLSKDADNEVARRILARYTEEYFESAKEWKKWVRKNRKNLFFTESGGYKWLVNTL